MGTTSIIIILLLVVLVIWIISIYNNLVKLKIRTKEALSDIDIQLKRRHDLIPNLVNTVKGYAKHEEEVFTKVTEARAKAINAQGIKEKAEAENLLSDTLKSLFAVTENYPELKANTNFLQLQDELVDTEDKIQAARRFYNANAREFNTKLQTFPNNIIANIFNFKAVEFFETDEKSRENVKVEF